ncbi:MAG: NAD(+) synthase [Candidatus Gastranaerophilales bacterium]|nr:NAD(+) synthase [Candidatus Gastranaerophilales bacterium]
MNIVLAQLNPIPADINYNKKKIIEVVKNTQAELIIFPKHFIYGYHNFDMLEKFSFIKDQINCAIAEIQKYTKNYLLISSIDGNYLINQNEIKKVDAFELNGESFKIIENENIETTATNLIYLDLAISKTNSEYFRNKKLIEIAKSQNKNLYYLNQIGAIDEYVYDGISRIINKNGEIIALAKAFEEDLLTIGKIEKNEYLAPINLESFSLNYENDLKRTYESTILAIKDYFSKNNFKQAVLGLSGGLDSTICAVLLADALGAKNILGVSMPSKLTSIESKSDGKILANNLGINYIEAPIKNYHHTFSEGFEEIFKDTSKYWCNRYTNSFTQDNIQARSRAMILWGIANEYGSTLPIATSDKSETYMGYATINGDMSGGFAPILDITKTKLFALARWMNENRSRKNAIPESVILKPPGAELAIDPNTGETLKAEDALMPYEFLDEVIWRIENLHQSINNMMQEQFLYEKKNTVNKETKKLWLEKFFKRMNCAIYKWYIAAPSPIVDSYSINKAIYKQPIVSNINY